MAGPVVRSSWVDSERKTDCRVETETPFYITSLALLANALGPMIRSHWLIENGLDWVLDIVFRNGDWRVPTDPCNLAIVKHIALNLLRTGKTTDSLRLCEYLTNSTYAPTVAAVEDPVRPRVVPANANPRQNSVPVVPRQRHARFCAQYTT